MVSVEAVEVCGNPLCSQVRAGLEVYARGKVRYVACSVCARSLRWGIWRDLRYAATEDELISAWREAVSIWHQNKTTGR